MLNPLGIFWFLAVASLIFLKIGRRVLFLSSVMIGLTWLFLISASPVPQWLMRNLESRFSTVDLKKIDGNRIVHIMVLGAGHTISPDLPPANQLSTISLSRLNEAVRIYRQLPDAKVVCSGFSSSERTTQAEMVALAALDLGVNPLDTVLMIRPSNTEEEVREYAARFGKEYQLILVTSASHMPRAMAHFSRFGIAPIPAPTNHTVKLDPERSPFNFKPSSRKIQMMESVLHEYGGFVEMAFD